jgi:hypothetical protein
MPQIISNESTFTAMFYDHEIDFYREFGRRRYNRMRAVGAVDRLYAKHLDRIENDLLGLLGEAAVAELLGVPMNLTESDESTDGAGQDIVAHPRRIGLPEQVQMQSGCGRTLRHKQEVAGTGQGGRLGHS